MVTAEQDHGPPSYATLIRRAREAQGMSPETAASHMPFKFSGSSWRQIEAGYRGSGTNRKPVSTKPSTLAAMAHTVGITADRLQEHHAEAAAILRERELQQAQQAPAMQETLRRLSDKERRIILAALEDVDLEDQPALLRELADDIEALRKRRARRAGRSQDPRRAG
ncbi:hypothetical protein ACFSL4_01430 [Streptomyces caeni]|uniref:XRE family transcriptional regulator n=1 Tax=Streptomyces caeni TaxID=2307231 RepID=A0ABW4IHY3_9ACTN